MFVVLLLLGGTVQAADFDPPQTTFELAVDAPAPAIDLTAPVEVVAVTRHVITIAMPPPRSPAAAPDAPPRDRPPRT